MNRNACFIDGNTFVQVLSGDKILRILRLLSIFKDAEPQLQQFIGVTAELGLVHRSSHHLLYLLIP